MKYNNVKKELESLENKEKAKVLQGFFKTGRGEYGEGDVFLGITVPEQRKVSRKYKDLELKDVEKLLNSKEHEARLVGLLILTYKDLDKNVFNFYLKNLKNVNNWDLVDLSSHKIIGEYLSDKDRKILYKLAKSKNMWERRIAIVSCFAFLRNNDLKDALNISEILINDKHDLIHKAVGWVLREIGKKDLKVEEEFLKKYYKTMPRTMLRYAIEKFDEKKRKFYLGK